MLAEKFASDYTFYTLQVAWNVYFEKQISPQ